VSAAQRLYATKKLMVLPAVPADQLLEGAGQADNSSDIGLTYMSLFCNFLHVASSQVYPDAL